jgi:subtilisin family serine protease
MKRYFRFLVGFLIVLLCWVLGIWMGRGMGVSPDSSARQSREKIPQARVQTPLSTRVSGLQRDEFRVGTTVEMFASMQPNEVIMRFPSEGTYGAFLYSLGGSKIRLVDQLDRLRAVRLGYDDWTDFIGLMEGESIIAYEALPAVPGPSPGGRGGQLGLVGFGGELLPWLGITADNSRWGEGVKIAVLDSGVVPHSDLAPLADSIEINPFPEDMNETHGHGTAVASLIAGVGRVSGVAPAAELISVRVGDESGRADSFALAAGILAAIDAGAQIINCSMGTTEDNPLVEEAVHYASQQNVLIVAASGNSEQAEACYPAAYPSVISVGAVDARGEHLDFSNYGTYLSLTAPGYAIQAAWPGNRYAQISGTSASAPLVAGAIAATMSNGFGVTMNSRQAAEIVLRYSNEAGIPGPDSEYGVGILDLGRIMNRAISGIVDAAITNQRFFQSKVPGMGDEIQVTVQNRGTAALVNPFLVIHTPFGSRQFSAASILPGQIKTFSMPVRLDSIPRDESIAVSSVLSAGILGNDVNLRNNQRDDRLFRH